MNNKLKNSLNIFFILLGSILFAINLNTFVVAGSLVPGGFSGLSILIQQVFIKYLNIKIPFSLLNITFNLFPAIIAYKYVGKRFTLFSCGSLVISSLLVDIIPEYTITGDILLICVFGGILGGFACSLILNSGASTGGTDFIAMSISAKYKISAFNYMFIFSAIIIIIYGILFGMDKALYSIIYQFCYTQVLNSLYKKFKKKTLFIITDNPKELTSKLIELTNHSATLWSGEGAYTKNQRYIVYTVLSDNDIKKISNYIEKNMPNTFVNILNSGEIIGNFFIKPI